MCYLLPCAEFINVDGIEAGLRACTGGKEERVDVRQVLASGIDQQRAHERRRYYIHIYKSATTQALATQIGHQDAGSGGTVEEEEVCRGGMPP